MAKVTVYLKNAVIDEIKGWSKKIFKLALTQKRLVFK